MIVALLRPAGADLVLMLAGHAIAGRFSRRLGMPLLPVLAVDMFAGCGLLALLVTLLGVVGGPTHAWPVLGLLLLVLAGLGGSEAVSWWRAGRERGPGRRLGWRAALVEPRWLPYAVCAAVTARFALSAWRIPVSSNDEYMMWAMRGRALAVGRLDPRIFGGAADPHLYVSREYPLGVPALYDWVAGWVGTRAAEFGAHAQVPLLGGCALVVAVWALQSTGSAVRGVLASLVIAPALFAVDWVGRYTGILLFADLPVAAAALVVVVLVQRWLTTGDHAWLWLAAGPAVAALYFKEEGLVFFAAPCLVAAAVALVVHMRQWWAPLVLLANGLLALLPWQAWVASQGIHNRLLHGSRPGYDLADRLHLGWLVLRQIGHDWPVPYPVWLLPLAAAGGVMLAVLRPALRPAVGFLGGTVAVVVGGIWAQYTLTAFSAPNPNVYMPSYMAFNAPRVLLLPTVLSWLTALAPAAAADRGRPAAEVAPVLEEAGLPGG